MDTLHPEFSPTKPVVHIDNFFKNELLAAASTLAIFEPKALPTPEVALGRLGLLDLPNEILLYIFEQLEDELYALAQLSRRMHHLALPIYLARNGMSPFTGSLVLFDERSASVLQALTIALFQPTLKCVSCMFNFYWPDRTVLRHIRGLVRLVRRLGVLHEAHLDFTNIQRFGHRDFKPLPEHYGGAIGKGDLEKMVVPVDWPVEVRMLLEAIVEKGCQVLTVCLAGWTALSTPGELKAALRRPSRSSSDGCFLDSFWMLFGQDRGATLPRDTEHGGELETFNLHSAMLLTAELCPWTVQTLNSASISTLSLRNIYIHAKPWTVILACITVPFLSRLSVDLCSIPYHNLAAFLLRHPRVLSLYLGRSLPAPCRSPLGHSDDLPYANNITHLSAAPIYLNHLLASPGAFPALQEVTIVARVHNGRHFDFAQMSSILQPIARRVLEAPLTGYGAPHIALTLELSCESSTDDWMLLDAPPEPRTDTPMLMRHVMKVELRIAQYRLAEEVVARLPRWLGQFPSLKEVLIKSPSVEGPTEVDQRGRLIRAVFRRCPNLKRLGINEVVRDIEGWGLLG